MSEPWTIYIGTILLEPNRWAKGRRPTFRVSEWADRLAEAGFDGMELWEPHATLAPAGETDALARSPLPVAIFNSYAAMDEAGAADRATAGELAVRLGARAVKFNVGDDPAQRAAYLQAVRQWRAELADDVTLLCEVHPGTIIETPAAARSFFDELGVGGWEIIVHPFNRLETLGAWLDAFGPAVTHAHLQMRDEDNRVVRFDRRPGRARKAVEMLREAGFAGTASLEFTEGTGESGESVERLLENAVRDLAFLREVLS